MTYLHYFHSVRWISSSFGRALSTNPRVKKEIEVSEKLAELSTDKLEVVLQMAKMLKDLK